MQDLLVGRAGAGHRPPVGGMHLVPWACEFVGTAMLLLGGLSAVCLDFGAHSPVGPHVHAGWVLRLITGLLFAGSGSLIAISPLGKRSGAHINPAVTLAFWTQGKVHRHDLTGYVVAQVLGGIAGAALVLLLWRGEARSVHIGATLPGDGASPVLATLIEVAMTAALVGMLLFFTSSARLAPFTPLANWFLVAALVVVGAPYTGTSLNPARSFGPALIDPVFTSFWVYVVGPVVGALLAVGGFALFRSRVVLTAKLAHDTRYKTTLGTALPAPIG